MGTWWTTPLSLDDLKVDSPYNTYLHPGLPPGPISNPGLAALQAVAAPAKSNYFYFQARCDKSGLHNFAETLEQHQQNNCPWGSGTANTSKSPPRRSFPRDDEDAFQRSPVKPASATSPGIPGITNPMIKRIPRA
jgi:hypothetical protein